MILKKLSLDDDCYDLLQHIDSNEYLFKNEVYGQSKEYYKEWLQKMYDWDLGKNLPAGYTRQTIFWLYVGNTPIGIAKLRHTLNDTTRQYGGNLGYALDKRHRGRGYGKPFIALLIKEARNLGIKELVATVEKDNIPSTKVIESFSNKILYENEERRSYVLY